MALFLCAEVALFGTMISSYFYLDFDAHRWPPAGIPDPSVLWPSIGTAVLVAMSVPMWLAARSARAGRRGPVLRLVSFAMVVQAAYLALQVVLLTQDLHKFKPQGSAYASIYYTLLVAHHAHVLFGLLLDITILVFVSFRGLTNYWLIAVRGLALYWHVVNVIAVFVLVVTLAPSL
jgi:cytochrome c oxidase subunit III